MPQSSANTIWDMLARVTLGLSGLVIGTLAVKVVLSTARRSRDWVSGQVRDSLRKELR